MFIANNAANIISSSSRGEVRRAELNGIKAFTTPSSRSDAADTLLYMVNYENEKGFVIIGAPQGSPDLVGVVEDGSYTDNLLSDNPAFGAYIDEVAKEIQYGFRPVNGDSATPMDPIKPGLTDATILEIEEWDIKTQVGPYVELRWGQKGIEGSLCPNRTAGCVMTATAQLLSWYERPLWLKLSYPGKPFDYLGLDWEDMKMHYVDPNYSCVSYRDSLYNDEIHNLCEASEEGHSQIAMLCRQLGDGAGATYQTVGGTGSNLDSMLGYLVYTYPQSFRNYAKSNGTSELYSVLQDKPCLMSGFADGDGNPGHAWLVDGFVDGKAYKCKYNVAEGREPILIERNLIGDISVVHVNWGWDGRCNGYFLPTHFHTNEGLRYDPDCKVYKDYNFYKDLNVYSLNEVRR